MVIFSGCAIVVLFGGWECILFVSVCVFVWLVGGLLAYLFVCVCVCFVGCLSVCVSLFSENAFTITLFTTA